MNLDKLEEMEKFDRSKVGHSISLLGNQIDEAWKAVAEIEVPKSYREADKVVVFGMGGSEIGADLVRHLFREELTVPIEIVSDYAIPAYVNDRTLAVLSSYSGTTEEVLTVAKKIGDLTEMIMVMTSGGDLAEIGREGNFPTYLIDPKSNPCGQPRIGVGYAIAGLLGLLVKAGTLTISDEEIVEAVERSRRANNYFGLDVPRKSNQAKLIAENLLGNIIVLAGAEHLVGNLHILANQINENGKNMAAYFAIPEMNHHLLEGLGNPLANRENLKFLLVNSDLYFKRNQKRFEVTKEVLKKNGIAFEEFATRESKKLWQSLEILIWGSYLSYYVALLNGVDPAAIPLVDLFKAELAKK